jgi:hypothetical protein
MKSHVQKHFVNAESAARLLCNRALKSPLAADRWLASKRQTVVYTGNFTS